MTIPDYQFLMRPLLAFGSVRRGRRVERTVEIKRIDLGYFDEGDE
jgi:restriction endonuclease Mrr